jgi:hypothetical protein
LQSVQRNYKVTPHRGGLVGGEKFTELIEADWVRSISKQIADGLVRRLL